ncbi:MAG: DUF6263 family protein [Flavipsychrobacter sp.]
MKYVLFIGILSILSGSLASCNQESTTNDNKPVKLLFHFEQDSTYKYLVKSDIEIKPQIGDKDISITQGMTIACKYKKTSSRGTSSNMSVTYDRIMISSGNDQNRLEFDSDHDNGVGKVFQSIREVIHQPFEMVITPYGNIITSSGIADPNNKGKYFSDTAFQKVMLQALQIYPKKIIQPGDIWERKFTSSIGFIHVEIVNNYKLMFVNNDVAHIELTGRINATNDNRQKIDINGIQRGSMDVALNSGLVTNGKMEQQLSGLLYLNGKETPVSINATTHIMGTKAEIPE